LIELRLPLPAYDQVLKCSHALNLLDARGAVSPTERAAYILRARKLTLKVARLYLEMLDGDAAG
jgi:glycyl-tRNA synthetase alpha chain